MSDGIDERSQGAMLRLDALVMRVQLNIRFLLEVCLTPCPLSCTPVLPFLKAAVLSGPYHLALHPAHIHVWKAGRPSVWCPRTRLGQAA